MATHYIKDNMAKLEVIAWTVEDAKRIEEGGADRIELVVDLEKGGLTPPIELTKKVVEAVNIPVRVMVRDSDQSFTYTNEEMQSHINYVKQLTQLPKKPEGIVFGSLTVDKEINYRQIQEIIEVKKDMKLTYHRAFDELHEPHAKASLKILSILDVDTVLTSGLAADALDGSELIKELIGLTKINILPGKSIELHNYKEILQKTNADYLHVGYGVRDENLNIDIDKIKQFKEGME